MYHTMVLSSLLAAFPLIFAAHTAEQRMWSSAFALPGANASYDYVVVGGGNAGLTIANRLAETASVAVIEAGGLYEFDNGNRSTVPLYGLTELPFIGTTEDFLPSPWMDWGLLSVPQTAAGDRKIHYAQGKTLGGGTTINTMAYHRATKGSHQLWADHVGDDSYTFDNLWPYFARSCHLTEPNLEKRNAPNTTINFDRKMCDNSNGGPLQVSWNNWVDPTITWLGAAVRSLGLPISPIGFSSGELAGYSAWIPSTISPENAHRSSSESSYLRQAISNTQIMVYPHTQATKILFDSNKKATGVRVSTQGVEYTVSAANEVIVSAGVFHSPQLLMVSGIGPRATLESQSIPVVSDLAGVGQNLHDPLSLGIMYNINTPSGAVIAADPANCPSLLDQYLNDASGPYSSAAGFMAYEKVPDSLRSNLSSRTLDALDSFPSDWPELEYIVGSFPGTDGATLGSITATMVKPMSSGNITISSSSMADQPVIDLGWLSDPADAEVAVAGFKRVREAWASDAANKIKIGDEVLPGASVQTDEQILEYICSSITQIWHASGTCAMGKEGDNMAVVDSKGKVFGVDGLRVVDISTFPFAIQAHPQGTVYMLAEKIADDIKNGQ